MTKLRLTVNGEAMDFEAASPTVAALVAHLRLDGPVAVERNGDVVPRAEHGAATLADGDVVEIVHFVGGG